MNNILVSIIIPTYNDWERLSLCLLGLANQTTSKDIFEIVIVNNNPDDHVPSHFILPHNCKILIEQKPGSYAARNAALKIVKGEIIGFTDSDCIPDQNWIKYALEYFESNRDCSRIAGKVSIFFKSLKPTGAELYDKIYAFNQKGYVTDSGTSVTANLFTYKSVFDKVGIFDETLMSGGDFLWGTLASKQGFKIDYVEGVVVNHPARESLKMLLKKERRVGGSQAIFLKRSNSMIFNFLRFLKDLLPHPSEAKVLYNNEEGLTVNQKIYIFFIRRYLLSIRAYEKLRVQMGKKANRA